MLALLFILMMFCNIQVGEFQNMFGIYPKLFASHNTESIYSSADLFLQNLQRLSIENMAALRYNLGVYEIRTTFTKYECDSTCLFAQTSLNIALYSGESMLLAVTNSLLSTATIAYLGAAFQYFTLQYIYGGLFLLFLPLAIVLRSVPFMRQLGGALIGIFVALYILYPLMINVDAFVAPGMAKAAQPLILYDRSDDGYDCAPGGVAAGSPLDLYAVNGAPSYVQCIQSESKFTEEGIKGGGAVFTTTSHMDDLLPSSVKITDALKVNVLIFLTAVFLPALNFVVIAVFAREISRFLGEEADISRLGQMI
ncbi:Uncharacterised protein [uncultured archaeon]|nr:Uncharacterised protein [uncultured archaeon]